MSSAELSVFIRAIGVHTPERKLTNAELSKMVDTSDEWIKTRSGIAERRIAAPGENPSDMGAKAAAKAEAAGLKVVMNRCPKIEFGRLSGELSWSGINSEIISSKRRRLL